MEAATNAVMVNGWNTERSIGISPYN